MKYLNLGCGDRYNSEWTNINKTSNSNDVLAHDLDKGIPFPDRSFDVVYNSHLLEHFPKNHAEVFLKECHRVLRTNGIIRVVVPDLERIAMTYLKALNNALNGSNEWADNYEWIMLEMYDQTVREHSGGDMAEYLRRSSIPNQEFVIERIGIEAKKLMYSSSKDIDKSNSQQIDNKFAIDKLIEMVKKIGNTNYLRGKLIKLLFGKEYKALEIGHFRQSGEVHLWMYDRYSLNRLLKECGFVDIVQRSSIESYLPMWPSWNLDTEPKGEIYKPDSLYMEARKL